MEKQDELIYRSVAAAYFAGDKAIPCGEARAAIDMCPAAELPPDWVSRVAIQAYVKEAYAGCMDSTAYAPRDFLRLLDAVPSVRQSDQRYGYWIRRDVWGEDPWECSECGNSVPVYGYHFCPNCGFPMRLGEKVCK